MKNKTIIKLKLKSLTKYTLKKLGNLINQI